MKDKLAKGVVWLGSAKVIINLLAVSSTLLLARLLKPEDFGVFALAITMLAIIGELTNLSLSAALIHHKNPTDIHYSTAWTLNLARAAIIGVIFCAAAPLAAWAYHEPRLLNIMFIMGASLVLTGLKNPKTVVLARNLIFWQDFVLTVSQKLIGFVVCLSIAVIYKSYWALVAGMVASQLAGILVSYIIIPFRPKFSFLYAKELWSFSIWLTLGQMVNSLNLKLDSLLVGGFLGTKSLGFYTVGDNLAGLVTRETIGPLESTLFPGFKQIVNDNGRLKNAYSSAQSLICSIALPVGAGWALIAHPVVLLGMGANWLPAVEVIQIIAVTTAFETLSSAVHPLAMAKGETKLLFQRDLISFLIRVPLIILGLYLGGLMGLLYARAASTTISIMMNMVLVRRLINTGLVEQFLKNIRSIISVIIMATGVYFLEYVLGKDGTTFFLIVKIITFVFTGALLYMSVHLLLWLAAKKPIGPETEVVKMIAKLSKKFRLFK